MIDYRIKELISDTLSPLDYSAVILLETLRLWQRQTTHVYLLDLPHEGQSVQ